MNKENLKLGKIGKRDAVSLIRWFNDPLLSKHMDDSEEGKTYGENDILEMIEHPEGSLYYAFRDGEKIIGYASLYDLDFRNKKAEFSFLIGDDAYKGKGLGKLLVDLICIEAREKGLKELYCSIYAANIPSLKSVEKAGFIRTKEIQGESNQSLARTEYYYTKQLSI